jgi:hypothetical protein
MELSNNATPVLPRTPLIQEEKIVYDFFILIGIVIVVCGLLGIFLSCNFCAKLCKKTQTQDGV